MKKLSLFRAVITAALLIVLVMSFGACNAQPVATTAAPSETPAASTATPEPTQTTLIMATNATFPPYEYQEGGKIVGIDAEIAQAIADNLGYKLKIQDMEFDSILPSVASGKADIGMAAITVTDERKKNVDFSDSYATGKQVIIVKEDSTISGPADLKGKKIGVQLSTTGDIYCTGDYGEDAMQRFNSGTDAVQALIQGKVDAVVIDNEPAKVYVSQNTGLKILPTEYITENYAIVIAKGKDTLLTNINNSLSDLNMSGKIKTIIDKYIKVS